MKVSWKGWYKLEDFKHILDVNPEVKGLKSANLYVNYDGLAQHYGIETDMLDLTNSPFSCSLLCKQRNMIL
jgi:hypothetical protein